MHIKFTDTESQTARIARIVGANYLGADWVWLTEVRTKTGWSTTFGNDLDSERYIDGFAFALIPSKNFQRIAYEFKVSRADWLAELKNPVKKAPAYFLSHQFWYVALPGVIDVENDFKKEFKGRRVIISLDGCGVIVVQPDDSLKIIISATKRHPFPMPETFVSSLLRRAAKVNGG